MKENKKSELDVKADEEHLLIDHSYDGIQELNHPLPNWWNTMFYAGIVFSTGYFIYYQVMGGPTLRDEFKVSYNQVLAAQAEFKRQNSSFNQEFYNGIVADDGVKKGSVVFETNCMPCHAEKGKGDIGPNLTDKHWLIAKSTPETIYNVAFNGSEENGMPAWGEMLTKEELYQAVSYVSSLKNTFAKGGKAPQGEKIED
jgi:cytochrome c oxidase cbb3-type subunit III